MELTARKPLFAPVATIICGLTLAALSWTPAKYMVRTGVLTRHEEHFLAYFVSGSLIAALWPGHPARIGGMFCAYAGVLDRPNLCAGTTSTGITATSH